MHYVATRLSYLDDTINVFSLHNGILLPTFTIFTIINPRTPP